MVEVRGQPLLAHIVGAYNAAGLKRITVVRGYLPEAIDLPALAFVDNPDYADTGELLSLARALEADGGDDSDLYVSYGDVIFKRYIIDTLAEPVNDFVIVADTDWHDSVNRGRAADYVRCSEPHSRHAFYRDVWLRALRRGYRRGRTPRRMDGLSQGQRAGAAAPARSGARHGGATRPIARPSCIIC